MTNRKQLFISIAAALILTCIIGAGVLQRFDKWAQDALYQHPRTPSEDIVIIGIDEKALKKLGPWPWSREVMGDVLMSLAADPEQKPAVTALDVLFEGKSDAAADTYLANAAAYLGNVVTAAAAEFGQSVQWADGRAVSNDAAAVVQWFMPYEALQAVTVQGHINAMADRDGILRHAMLYVRPEGGMVYSMAYETARVYLEKRGQSVKQPPVNTGGHFYVPFTAAPGSYYDRVSVVDLIDGNVDPAYWAGKIVLIGPYAQGLQDSYFTSINRALPMFGVEFQANVIQSLLEDNHKAEAANWPQIAVLLIVSILLAVFYVRLKIWRGGLLCLGVMLVSTGLSFAAYALGFVVHVLWVPAAALVLYLIAAQLRSIQYQQEKQALALKEERINAELSLAARIQANALPKVFPPFPERKEFDIYASMTPAKEVGGDLYDFFLMDEDHLCLVIGDVTGKGVPASLFMMVARTLIHHVAMREKSPAVILHTVNQEICTRNPDEMFVTVWLGVLEISTGKLTAANAGHEYPAYKKADGHFELYKDKHGLVVGSMDIARYRDYEIQMEKGDQIFVYTDGVPEATNSQEAFYTTDRMIEALRWAEGGSPQDILAAVHASVQDFAGGAPQFDDLTMLCLEYKGPEDS